MGKLFFVWYRILEVNQRCQMILVICEMFKWRYENFQESVILIEKKNRYVVYLYFSVCCEGDCFRENCKIVYSLLFVYSFCVWCDIFLVII